MIAIIVLHAPAGQLGVLTAASWTPYLFALMIGAMVDRIRVKRIVLVVTDLARAACLATIPIAYVLGRMTMVHLIFVVIAASLAGIRVDEPAHEHGRRRDVVREAVEGMRTLLRNPWLSSALWCTTTMNLASYAILARRIGLYRVVLSGCLLFSLPYAALAVMPAFASPTGNVALLGCCVFVVTGGIMLYDIMINSVMAKVMPDAMRGRLVGAFSSINYGIVRHAGAKTQPARPDCQRRRQG